MVGCGPRQLGPKEKEPPLTNSDGSFAIPFARAL